jgi:ankyrin repeat protein
MKQDPRRLLGVVTALVSMVFLTSCLKREQTVKSDLGEAGYELTSEDWFRASRENDAQALKKFAAAGFDVTTRDAAGDTALHAAAKAGAQASADFLLSRKLSLELRGASQRTPLMEALLSGQPRMARWLLRQGADPRAKDAEGYTPLLLAVRENRADGVREIAAYDRAGLDDALLLAALVGGTEVVDELTNHGASIFTRMEDGRTALMIAAENGHLETVKLLVEIGASRFTTDAEGRTAADIAKAAEHPEIVAALTRDPEPADFRLESDEEIAREMDAYVDAAATAREEGEPAQANFMRGPARSIEGAALSPGVIVRTHAPVADRGARFPPLVMRHFREKEVPVSVKSVVAETATLQISGANPREVKVRVGGKIPGSGLTLVRVERRLENSKVNPGSRMEISTVVVRDGATGTTREWIAGVPAKAHDPAALVEDAVTGQRYIAAPGQRFKGADGTEYLVSDVRPNQLVIQELATGEVQTIALRGPRG